MFLEHMGVNKEKKSSWQEFSFDWHIGPELDTDGQRQKIGNSMSIIVLDESDDVIDPSTFNFGKVTNTILFIRKIESTYRLSLCMNIITSSNILFFNSTEEKKLFQLVSKNYEDLQFITDEKSLVMTASFTNVKQIVHSALFFGILKAYQFHPQLIKVIENAVVSKFGEIAVKFAPKIIKNINKSKQNHKKIL